MKLVISREDIKQMLEMNGQVVHSLELIDATEEEDWQIVAVVGPAPPSIDARRR